MKSPQHCIAFYVLLCVVEPWPTIVHGPMQGNGPCGVLLCRENFRRENRAKLALRPLHYQWGPTKHEVMVYPSIVGLLECPT